MVFGERPATGPAQHLIHEVPGPRTRRGFFFSIHQPGYSSTLRLQTYACALNRPVDRSIHVPLVHSCTCACSVCVCEFATTTMPRIRLRGMDPPPLPETEVKQARFECRQLYDRSVAVQAHLCYAMRKTSFVVMLILRRLLRTICQTCTPLHWWNRPLRWCLHSQLCDVSMSVRACKHKQERVSPEQLVAMMLQSVSRFIRSVTETMLLTVLEKDETAG